VGSSLSTTAQSITHHTAHAVDHTPLRPCTAICSLATSPPILLTHFLCPHIARCCRMPRGAPEPEPRGGGGGASNMHWEMRRKEERVRRGLIATTGRVPKVRTCAALHKHLTHPLLRCALWQSRRLCGRGRMHSADMAALLLRSSIGVDAQDHNGSRQPTLSYLDVTTLCVHVQELAHTLP